MLKHYETENITKMPLIVIEIHKLTILATLSTPYLYRYNIFICYNDLFLKIYYCMKTLSIIFRENII